MADRGRTPNKRSAFFRGDAGARRTDEELEHARQKAEQRKALGNQPFRFRVPIGETRQVIICDDKPDFFMYEHSLKDAEGNWGKLFTGCVKEFDNCPVCESTGKESYYAMVLTVVDLTEFTLRDGTKVEFSRKLLIVKPAQQKKFLRFYQKEGTLRGALFDMTRDGDKDPQIGNDIEFVEFVSEDEMESYVRTWRDKDGKKHTEICGEPYEYEDLFEEPTTEKLRAIVGGRPTPGSRAHEEDAVGGRRSSRSSSRGGRSDDDTPRGRDRGRSSSKSEDDWEPDADDVPFEPDPPARSTRRGRAAEPEDEQPTRSTRRGRAAEPEEDDEPPARSSRRGRAAEPEEDEPPARSTRRGRAPEPEEDDEPPPRRPAARRTR